MQFPATDGKKLITAAPGLLSIHVLRPYPGWEDFRGRIDQALAAYIDVCRPKGYGRVGVRYVNRLSLRGEKLTLEKYFKFLPTQPEGLPENLRAFLHRNELAYGDGSKLVLTFASIPSTSPEEHGFVLDLDVIRETADVEDLATAMATAEDLRQRERVAFEAIITDSLREMFDAD